MQKDVHAGLSEREIHRSSKGRSPCQQGFRTALWHRSFHVPETFHVRAQRSAGCKARNGIRIRDHAEHEITRSGRAVSGETEHVAVPWSGLCRFFVDGEAAASLELTDLNLNPVSTPEELTADAEIELMECVLAFRDYPAEMTSFQTEMMERIRVGVPGTEQEAKAYVVQSPLWFSNESLWRLEWRPVPGADRYELSYTDETGETISVILELGEEAAP